MVAFRHTPVFMVSSSLADGLAVWPPDGRRTLPVQAGRFAGISQPREVGLWAYHDDSPARLSLSARARAVRASSG
jgi:hypothetical protein